VPVTSETRQMVLLAAEICEEKKATDTRILELDPADAGFTDFFLITSCSNTRQTGAVSEEIELRMKRQFGTYAKSVEGRRTGEWILLDYIDFVVHIFTEETREYYDIERLRKSARTMGPAELSAALKQKTAAVRNKASEAGAALALVAGAAKKAPKKAAKKAPVKPTGLAKAEPAQAPAKQAAKKAPAKKAPAKKAPAKKAAAKKAAAKKAPAKKAPAKKAPAKKAKPGKTPASQAPAQATKKAPAKKAPAKKSAAKKAIIKKSARASTVEDTSPKALGSGARPVKQLAAPKAKK
jgi:ribosome-associated protein